MSPIISFRDDEPKPPPFSSARLTPDGADGGSPVFGLANGDDASDDGDLPAFPASDSYGPPSSPYESPKVKPPGGRGRPKALSLHGRERSGEYGAFEREGDDGEAEDGGLLQYEMDVLDGSRRGGAPGSPNDYPVVESLAKRRERGEWIISGGYGAGWLGLQWPSPAGVKEILSIVYETAPTLLLTLLGLVFTGELLEHLSRWTVFERVDELFILVPTLTNLKGNLEMCLGARLSTSANIGELDIRETRRGLVLGQLSLLQMQALAVSFLAGILSFLLGLTLPHRISDEELASVNATAALLANGSSLLASAPRDLAIVAAMFLGERADPDEGYIDSFKEGFTPPGGKELMIVLVTGMVAASLSSGILGSFMSGLVVLSRRLRINPDNISTPIASCLSDLVTLFILGVIGAMLVPYISTPIPFLCLPVLIAIGLVFTFVTWRNTYVRPLMREGWTPLLSAMAISGATGMVLERCVGWYEGYAILAVSMTGLSGAVGSIYASRLSTVLHVASPPAGSSGHSTPAALDSLADGRATPRTIGAALFAVSIPIQAVFVGGVLLAGWMRPEWQLIASVLLVSPLTVILCLVMADRLTLFFWAKGLDPDSYCLPILNSLIDLFGQLLLLLAFEMSALLGADVRVKDVVARH